MQPVLTKSEINFAEKHKDFVGSDTLQREKNIRTENDYKKTLPLP